MPEHAYSEINLHITWHVKHNEPALHGQVEKEVHRYVYARAIEEPQVFVHEIGGTDDHIHLVATIPPTVLISEWIGRLKGASSHFMNHAGNGKVLEWQQGYGVVSFATRHLQWVVDYVRDQRKHHAENKTIEELEKTE